MRRIVFLILILCFIMVQNHSAKNITRDQARTVAVSYFYKITFKKKAINSNNLKIAESYTFSENGLDYYHVFNFESGGFIIIAAEDRVVPVLAYSYKNTCPDENVSPEFEWWMKSYVEQIKLVRDNNIEVQDEVSNKWKRLLSNDKSEIKTKEFRGIEPMLVTQWDQGGFYNEMCPADNEGQALTGCVATALGQLLCYFRHPEQGEGAYSYIDENYGEQSVNFSEQTYNYDIMPVKLRSENPEVAKLLYHLGVSVDMHYGPDGSGMTNHKGAYTLKTYFDYKEESRYYFRDSVEMDWIDTLINHLDRGIPLYYAGWSDTLFISGHAFICDGYQDSTYFHFNWGWGGSFDGYFNLEYLTPGGSNFNLLHEMIANAIPENNYPHYFSGRKEIANREGLIDDGSGPINNYQGNNYCEWYFDINDSLSGIQIEFLRFETLEEDVVTIYNGPTTHDPILGVFSDSEIPGFITGTRSSMLVTFESKSDSSASGFLFAYKCIDPVYCTTGNMLTELTGTIDDGSEDYDYLNNSDCSWTIETDEVSKIGITFNTLNTEPDNDYVRFYDSYNSEAIATYSGIEIPEPFEVETKTLKVFFRTNESVRSEGFELSYSISSNLNELNLENKFLVYPNPAGNHVFINSEKLKNKDCIIKLYSIDGKLLLQKFIENNQKSSVEINVSNYKKGFYVLEIEMDGLTLYEKIVIKRK